MTVKQPTYLHYILSASLGSAVWVAIRLLGALALNGLLDWPHFLYFFTSSFVLPKHLFIAMFFYVVVGLPLFIMMRKREKLSPLLFSLAGGVVGFLAGFPEWTVLPWPALHVLCGALSALSVYYCLSALSARA